MARITLTITDDMRHAITAIAQHERRDPRAQAAIVLRDALVRLGYLRPEPKPKIQLANVTFSDWIRAKVEQGETKRDGKLYKIPWNSWRWFLDMSSDKQVAELSELFQPEFMSGEILAIKVESGRGRVIGERGYRAIRNLLIADGYVKESNPQP